MSSRRSDALVDTILSDPIFSDAVLSVDVGTTALKGALLARSGALLGEAEVTVETFRPQEGHAEQSPQGWWAALVTLCRQLSLQGEGLKGARALILCGQMQGLVLTRVGVPSGPALLHTDVRALQEVGETTARLGLDPQTASGNPYTAASLPPRLAWLARHAPQRLTGRPRLHVGAKDALIERLCGAHVTDHATAATSGLYDLARGRWQEEWLPLLGLDLALPRLRWPHEQAGLLGEDAASALGLAAGLPVLTGLGDAGATTLGAGVSGPGEQYLYLGTSGWVGTVSTGPPARPGVFRLPLLSPDRVLAVAPLRNAGSAHRWAAETFAGGAFERLETLMGQAPASSVLCLPYLEGERSPVDDPHARGVFLGLDQTTGPGVLARAVLEGVAFALRQAGEQLGAPHGGQPHLTLLGGGARSGVWRQILADVFATTIRVPESPALLPVLGGAYPAFRWLGWTSSFTEYRARVLSRQPFTDHPADPARAAQYARDYRRFEALYPAVCALFLDADPGPG